MCLKEAIELYGSYNYFQWDLCSSRARLSRHISINKYFIKYGTILVILLLGVLHNLLHDLLSDMHQKLYNSLFITISWVSIEAYYIYFIHKTEEISIISPASEFILC